MCDLWIEYTCDRVCGFVAKVHREYVGWDHIHEEM
jgi:hypothetical protein